MTIIDTLANIQDIYQQTSRVKIMKKYGHSAAVNVGFMLYAITCIMSLFVLQKEHFFLSILLIAGSAVAISAVFTSLITYDFPALKSVPFFKRDKYARFIEFKTKLDQLDLSDKCINKLISWSEIEEARYTIKNYWANPVALVLISAAINLGLSSDKLKPQALEMGMIGVYMIFCALLLLWLLQDLVNTSKRHKFEIQRFIKWYQLELTDRTSTKQHERLVNGS